MSSSVSYEYFNNKMPFNTGITQLGGVYGNYRCRSLGVIPYTLVKIGTNTIFPNSYENLSNISDFKYSLGVVNSSSNVYNEQSQIIVSGVATILVEDNTLVNVDDYIIFSSNQLGRSKSNGTEYPLDMSYYVGLAITSCTSGINNSINVLLDFQPKNTSGFTSDGGTYRTYTNRSQNFATIGGLATLSTYDNNSFAHYSVEPTMTVLGVMIDNSAIGSSGKLVTDGKVRILVEDNSIAINRGDYLIATQTANQLGKVKSVGTTKPTQYLIGVALENVTSGTGKTVLTQLMLQQYSK